MYHALHWGTTLAAFLGIGCLLFLPAQASAQIVVSEVLWAGSDLSSSDEWVEIVNTSESPLDIGGFTLWMLSSKGVDSLMLRFATGTILDAGEIAIVSNAAATSSRLLLEPRFTTSAMSLPNTKLLLTLRDASGHIVDQVDDGIGAPFAGANPSGGTKASMERIDLFASGTDAKNWQTAILASGLDPVANLFATPGALLHGSNGDSSSSSSSSSCSDPLAIAIYVQDGEISGIEKTTVNFQAVATEGSISGVPCAWTFSDGYTSTSCNPPPHSFTKIGVTSVLLEAKNQCGITLKQILDVHVASLPQSSSATLRFTDDGSRLVLVSALPNPEGADTGVEWVKIRNLEDHTISLDGWSLVVGSSKATTVKLAGTIGPREVTTIQSTEQKFSLSNSSTKIILRSPGGSDMSIIEVMKPEEGREYYPEDLRSLDLRAKVLRVLDGDTIEIELPYEARDRIGEDTLRVRLLGIDAPELLIDGSDDNLSLTAKEFLRDLIEGESIDLEFDTELWDSYGRLLVYAIDFQGRIVQEQMLEMGLAETMHAFPLRRIEHLREVEASAKQSKRGIWSLLQSSFSSSQRAASSFSSPSSLSMDDENAPSLRFSEIYAHPVRDSDQPFSAMEWLEISNPTAKDIALTGLRLVRGGKIRPLPPMSIVPAGGFLLLDLSTLTLALPDAGGSIELRSSDDTVIDAVSFPSLREGMSFALDPSLDTYCITRTPTPEEENRCTDPLTRSQTAKVAAMKKAAIRYEKYASDYATQLDNASQKEPLKIDEITDRFVASSSAQSSIAFLTGALVATAGLFAFRFGRLL